MPKTFRPPPYDTIVAQESIPKKHWEWRGRTYAENWWTCNDCHMQVPPRQGHRCSMLEPTE